MRPTAGWFPPPRAIALVFVGGAAGTAFRAGLVTVTPSDWAVPVGILAINVVGSFLLAVLVGVLGRVVPLRHGRDLRLLLGTGVLGGFTTYSALAGDTVSLAAGGDVVTAILYPAATVLLGVVAALVGVAVVRPVDVG